MSSRLAVNAQAPEAEAIARLRRHLDRDGVAALPTDTVYGLAANALRPEAVARVFTLKGRSFHKPLPVVVRDLAQAAELAAALPPLFHRLAAAFWPGPLTLVVAAAPHLPAALTAGTGAVGMRQPNLPLLAALLAATGYPLTATSANRSGQPECRTAPEVEAQWQDAEAADIVNFLVVDGGRSPLALPSTLVDLTQAGPKILREGAIPTAALEKYWRG